MLAIGGKPTPFRTLTSELVTETRWVAERLVTALNDEEERLGRALIDSGGPYWSRLYDDFVALSGPDRAETLNGLVQQSVKTARALVREARADEWTAILTEVVNPLAWVEDGETSRLDALVRRAGGRPPLLLDIKTTMGRLPSTERVDAAAGEVADAYAEAWVQALGEVGVATLHVDQTGRTKWSSEVRRRRSRAQGLHRPSLL